MPALLSSPPKSLCILRLSAIGDACHVLPVIATLRRRWPDVEIHWIISRPAYDLVAGAPGVHFHVVPARPNPKGLLRLAQSLRGRAFDALLHLHPYLKANLLSPLIRAPIKLGYDRARSRDGHQVFTTHSIPPAAGQHVQMAYLSFAAELGATAVEWRWDVDVPSAVQAKIDGLLPHDGRPIVALQLMASNAAKTWTVSGCAAVVRRAVERSAFVVLVGGPAPDEHRFAVEVTREAGVPCSNLVGQLGLKELFALFQKTAIYVGPDTGPTHIADAAGAHVIGLYGATDPCHTGPWRHLTSVVSVYGETLALERGKAPDRVRFGTRFYGGQPLQRLAVEPVLEAFDRAWTSRVGTYPGPYHLAVP